MPLASTKVLPLLLSAVLAGAITCAKATLAADRETAMNAVRTRDFSIGFSCGSMAPYGRDADADPLVPEPVVFIRLCHVGSGGAGSRVPTWPILSPERKETHQFRR